MTDQEDAPVDNGPQEVSGTAEGKPSNDEMFQNIGQQLVTSGIYNNNVADRTGELLRTAHDVSAELRKDRLVTIAEPGTGVEGIAVLSGGGGVSPLPAHYFDDYRDAPKATTGTASMTRIESFIDHVNRFKDGGSVLFAHEDMTAPRLTAVLDYDVPDSPRFGYHNTRFAFPMSMQWQAWLGKNDVKMSLTEFAEFLEDRFVDVEDVDATSLSDVMSEFVSKIGGGKPATKRKLLELSRGLSINENSAVSEARNIASGEGEVIFTSQHVDQSGNKVSVPSSFIITVPVFAQGHFYRIGVRLRYRKSNGLMFWYELWGIDDVFEQAFTEVCIRARDETGLPLLFGAPETD